MTTEPNGFRPAPIAVPFAGYKGSGTPPLPRASSGTEQSDNELYALTQDKLPQFDPDLHAKLFQRHEVNGEPHYFPPQMMTAREILSTHKLNDELGGLSREEVYGKKMDDFFDLKHGNLNSTSIKGHAAIGDTGSAAGLEESLTTKGYDLNSPVRVAIGGQLRWANDLPRENVPTVVNGQHRLMWMFTHHPDVPMPIDVQVHRHAFDTREERDAIIAAQVPPTQGDLRDLQDAREKSPKRLAVRWLDNHLFWHPDGFNSEPMKSVKSKIDQWRNEI